MTRNAEEGPADLQEIKADELEVLDRDTRRWRGFMYNLAYELNQLREMHTICEDATIKVRRLVHNFRRRMENVEDDVWDENHVLREDFSFTGIASYISPQ